MKKGISLVALIITIIVLIILTAAVVITGINTPQNAQLAVFLNNITTVQEAVNMKMLNNMAKYATTEGDLEKYKWVGVIAGYTEEDVINNVSLPESVLQIAGQDVLSIDESLKNELSINEDELAKYFVTLTGQVYYEGFEYNGITYYNATITSTTPEQEVVPVVGLYDGLYNTTKGVNSPKLDTGMIAVYWDTNGNEIRQYNEGILNTNFVYNDWYDYVASTESFATDNTESKWANAVTEDGSYWVWIPRYAYSIGTGFQTSTSSPIEIEFMKGKTNETALGRTTFQNALGQGNWNIHPAFSYVDGTENILSGIWVAKYEMSNNDGTPKSIAGTSSWRSISISTCFTNSYNMNRDLESHLMRNCEWGAVAYLAQSKYGRNGVQVSIASDYATGGNVIESTTGNIYGIYDMNGGAWEYVAAGLTSNAISTFGSINSKYYDAYVSYGDRYGDAVRETSSSSSNATSWYVDFSYFVIPADPFFVRGAYYDSADNAGLFAFSLHAGGGLAVISFRTVLWGST
ncbi:MAG: hypothetical protein PHH22_03570 [Clostridia bacterium]|nr:hypothetical protein [Clostridia bacterium]